MSSANKYIFHYDVSRLSTTPEADKRYRKYDGQECTTSSAIDSAYVEVNAKHEDLVAVTFSDGYKCNVYVSELEGTE